MNLAMCHLKGEKDARGKPLTKKARRRMLKERNYQGCEYDEWVRRGKLIAALKGQTAWIKLDGNGRKQLAAEGPRHHPLLNFISHLQSSLGPNVIHRLYRR